MIKHLGNFLSEAAIKIIPKQAIKPMLKHFR